jgi:hypothetical protein
VSHEQPSSQKFGASEREPTEATVTISDAKPSQVVATDGGRVLENTTLPPASGPAGNSPISLDCSDDLGMWDQIRLELPIIPHCESHDYASIR